MIASEHGEKALDRLADLDAFFQHADRSLSGGRMSHRLAGPVVAIRGRLSANPAPRALEEERRTLCELALVRVVSIVENFVLDLGRHEVDGRLAATTVPVHLKPLVGHLRDFRWDAVTGSGSWVKPMTMWDEALGVKASTDFHGWQALEFIRATRNLIVHGLGVADEKWFGTARALRRVTALGIAQAKAEGRIPVDRNDVEHGVRTAREFVFWLDRQRMVI